MTWILSALGKDVDSSLNAIPPQVWKLLQISTRFSTLSSTGARRTLPVAGRESAFADGARHLKKPFRCMGTSLGLEETREGGVWSSAQGGAIVLIIIGGTHPVKKRSPGNLADLRVVTPSGNSV